MCKTYSDSDIFPQTTDLSMRAVAAVERERASRGGNDCAPSFYDDVLPKPSRSQGLADDVRPRKTAKAMRTSQLQQPGVQSDGDAMTEADEIAKPKVARQQNGS